MSARGPILRLLRSVEKKESPMTTWQLGCVWIVIILNIGLLAYGIIQLILTGHWPAELKD
jgi:hypothetical protein